MIFQIIKKKSVIEKTNQKLNPNEVYIVHSNDIQGNNLFSVEYDIFSHYQHILDKNVNNIFMMCCGGIGDIITHSSICSLLKDKNIHFVTNYRYKDIFDWFEHPVQLLDIRRPVLLDYSFQNRLSKYKNYRWIHTENIFLTNNDFDWYEILLRHLYIDSITEDFLRPHLNTKRISNKKSNIKHKNALLICNKSTAMMRNIEFKEIYDALGDDIKSKYTLYAYKENLSPEDLKYTYNDVIFIKANTIGDFLLDLYDAKEVISVDSSPIHFREGIQKHCIALFNSFTKEIRTKHYKYINAFNIYSECELQPCFKHDINNKHICDKVNEWQFSAPCFRSENNKFLKGQLIDIFNTYL